MSALDPSPEELAAIVAAIEVSWPRPVAAAIEPEVIEQPVDLFKTELYAAILRLVKPGNRLRIIH